jgi:hypothetical protein
MFFLKLLPLPDGISVDPSEDYLSNEDGQRVNSKEYLIIKTLLLKILCRGNSQWAPPREQLIFHIHQPAKYIPPIPI